MSKVTAKKTTTAKPSSKSARRIEVIQDVLASLGHLHVKASNGYIIPRNEDKALASCKLDSKEGARNLQQSCNVCAKGALFLSQVALHNKFDLTEFENPGVYNSNYFAAKHSLILSKLRELFTAGQISLVETAFEKEVFRNGKRIWEDEGDVPTKKETRAIAFGSQYRAPRARLRAIMENMLNNQGFFVP